jgi:starch synthase (maltosyl-transferring)
VTVLTGTREKTGLSDLARLAATRVAIEAVSPQIDGGRFPAKGVVGRRFVVEADIFCDGHEKIDAALLVRPAKGRSWHELPMRLIENDRWRGTALFDDVGAHLFSIVAWRDRFATWQDEVAKKYAAGVSISLEIVEGIGLVEEIFAGTARLSRSDKAALNALRTSLRKAKSDGDAFAILMKGDTTDLMRRVGARENLSELAEPVPVWIDRERALFSAWYELMPRSMSFSRDATARSTT